MITLIYSVFETGIWSLNGPSQRHEGFHPEALYNVITICASREISRTLARTEKARNNIAAGKPKWRRHCLTLAEG
jgi:hypothetical protein